MTDPAGPTAPPPSSSSAPLPRAPRRPPANPLRLAVLVALIVGAALAVLYKRSTQRRSDLLRAQQLCLNYERPADLLAYEEHPARAAVLLGKDGGAYVAVPTGDASNTGDAPGGSPIAGHVPDVWRAMLRWASPATAGDPQDAVLFLHERQTADGHRGLVCVQADRRARRLRVTFIHPGASTLDPVVITGVQVVPAPQEGLVFLSPGPDPFEAKLPSTTPPDAPDAAGAGELSNAPRADLRFYAGQPDPDDPTHFTIRYAHGPRHGQIDLWMQDERTVHFEDHTVAAPPTSAPFDAAGG